MIVLSLIGMLSGAFPLKAEPRGDPANWVVASDIPPSEWARATVTSYDLTVDSRGTPAACTITTGSGSDIIDSIVCKSLMRRARYKPAKDDTGSAIASVIRDHVQWHPDASGPNQYLRDLPEIIVSDSTASSKTRFDLAKVVEIVGASGAVETCIVYKSSKNERLDQQACTIVSRPDISKPVLDASGAPIRGVRAFNVGFVNRADNQIFVR